MFSDLLSQGFIKVRGNILGIDKEFLEEILEDL